MRLLWRNHRPQKPFNKNWKLNFSCILLRILQLLCVTNSKCEKVIFHKRKWSLPPSTAVPRKPKSPLKRQRSSYKMFSSTSLDTIELLTFFDVFILISDNDLASCYLLCSLGHEPCIKEWSLLRGSSICLGLPSSTRGIVSLCSLVSRAPKRWSAAKFNKFKSTQLNWWPRGSY